jgi:thioesterase domain-containing protein
VFDGHLPGAERIDRARRIEHLVRQALSAPAGTLARLRARAGELLARGRRMARPAPAQPVELPLDGPLVEQASRRFERHASGLRGHLLVFRATVRKEGAWVGIAPDFGWSGRSRSLSLHDIDAGHLALVRTPAVGKVARILAAAMATAEGTADGAIAEGTP